MFLIPPEQPRITTLDVHLPANVRSAVAIGDYNDWKLPGIPLAEVGSTDEWRAKAKVSPGVYTFVVLVNGEAWVDSDKTEKDAYELVVVPAEYALHPAVRDDGVITASAVAHDPAKDGKKCNQRTFELTFRTRKDDVRAVTVAVSQEGRDQKIYPLAIKDTNPLYDFFKVKIVIDPSEGFQYRFFLNDGRGSRTFDTKGLANGMFGGEPFKSI